MSDIKLFETKKVRTHWDEEKELWYFSVQDVVEALTDSADVKQYIKKLRSRDPELFNNWGTICTPVEMIAADGKMRKIQAATTEGLFRIIQSIPSAKAEPFKLWLAKIGSERIEETEDPELSFDRAMETYLAKGYSKSWINQRLKSIEVRKELTDEWESVKQYKQHKTLKKENLRDHMTNLELVLNMLAEATTSEISKSRKPKTLDESKVIAKQGGTVAGNARKEIETKTGEKVVSSLNAKQIAQGKPKKKLK